MPTHLGGQAGGGDGGADMLADDMPSEPIADQPSVPAQELARLPFVGRSAELNLIEETAGDVELPAIVFCGGPGVGKSRLLEEGSARAARTGTPVLWLAGHPLHDGLAYASLAALRPIGPCPSVALRNRVRSLRRVIHDHLGEINDAVRAALIHTLDPEGEPSTLLLIIDDLALLDASTLQLVAEVARSGAGVRIAAAYRTSDLRSATPHSVFLDRCTREELIRSVPVPPLDVDSLNELAAAAIGSAPDAEALNEIQQDSGGVPLFAIHQKRYAVVGHDIPSENSSDNEHRRALMLEQVFRDDLAVRRVAQVAAVLGSITPSRLPLAAELLGMPVSEAEAAFDRLADLEVLTSMQHSAFRLTHPVLADALHADIGPAERWRWHRRAWDWLATLAPTPDLELEIARHAREAGEFGDDDAIAVLSAAGDQVARTSPRDAIMWYQGALALIPPERSEHAEVSGRLARVMFVSGRLTDAVDEGRHALEGLPPGIARERLVAVLIEALGIKLWGIEEAAALIDAEMAAGATNLRLASQAAYVFTMAGRREDAESALDSVLSELDKASPTERINALVELITMCSAAGHAAQPALIDRLRSAAADAPLSAQLNAFSTISFSSATRGDTALCSESLARAHELLAASGWNLYRADLLVSQVQNSAHLGEWDHALASIAGIRDELEEGGFRNYLFFLRWIEAEIFLNRGEWAAAKRAMSVTPPPHSSQVAVHAATLAQIDLQSGDPRSARKLIEDQLSREPLTPQLRGDLFSRLADVDLAQADRERAQQHVKEVEDLGLDQFPHSTYIRCRTTLARATGDPKPLLEAREVADLHRLSLARGTTRLHLGLMDVESPENLTQAASIFRLLGASPWRRLAVTELRRLGLPIPRLRFRDSRLLTPSEEQIARLVQLGRSNPEIAKTVYLSVKTVERYLSRMYAKTGCANRFELARALDAGLLDQNQ